MSTTTPHAPERRRRVLVAVDGSDASQGVARFVNEFFGELPVEVTGINVGPAPLAWGPAPIAPGALYAWHVSPPVASTGEEDREVLTDAAERIIERSGLEADERVAELGDPVDLITRAALDHDVDLIVVGSSHKNLLERFLSGSVSQDLARDAPVPVLVVH